MFGLFKNNKRKSLIKKRDRLLKEAFKVSKINRSESDALYAKVQEIELEIIKLDQE